MHDSDTTDSSNPAATGGNDSLPAGSVVHTASSSNGAATTIADHDLTSFQQTILTILAEEARYGLAIKEELEAYYGDDISPGRLYPNLGTLADLGFVAKNELDYRTNQYELTTTGRAALREQLRWALERVDVDGGDA
jgi:DNA-binding HxlR family transcriptional regulator